MNIKIFGYGIERSKLPTAFPPSVLYKLAQCTALAPLDSKGLIRIAATPLVWKHDNRNEDWWGGILIKARDAKTFNQLDETDGAIELSATEIEKGKVAEVSYFVAHGATGNGLIACYHNSPSLPTLSYCMKKLFRTARLEAAASAVKGLERRKEKVAALKNYRGKLSISGISRSGDFKSLLKELDTICSVDLTFKRVDTTQGAFSKWKAKATGESIKLVMPPEFILTDPLADEMIKELKADDKISATVRGKSVDGEASSVNSNLLRNKLIFAEKDYDDLHAGLKLKLSNWEVAIRDSKVINWLKVEALGPNARLKLTT